MKIDPIIYDEYISSPTWAAVKSRLFRRRGRRCEACGSKEKLDVHHGTYARFTRERDEDLFVLCGNCHRALHAFHRASGQKLMVATRTFIEKARTSRHKPVPVSRVAHESKLRLIIRDQIREGLESGDGRDHTPEGWLPAHLRPENRGRDWREERRSLPRGERGTAMTIQARHRPG